MLPIPLDTVPMEASSVDQLPTGSGRQFEPKWDGFRCLAFRDGASVALQAKSGKSLSRYFPEILAALAAAEADRFVLDGELVIPAGAALSFDALEGRLHPAVSRIQKLSKETPALLILFDCLAQDGHSLLATPLTGRRAALEALFPALGSSFRLTPQTSSLATAQRWLARAGGAMDGVVAKPLDGAYQPGLRAMLKVKNLRTADCVVGGFRYQSNSREVGSLLLGLYNPQGQLDHVGFTSGISAAERPALTARLEPLIAAPGFTGNTPGGPSRWSTERSTEWQPLRPELVAEVRYDHTTAGRFRHGTALLRWRPDKSPAQCTTDQLAPTTNPNTLIDKTLRS